MFVQCPLGGILAIGITRRASELGLVDDVESRLYMKGSGKGQHTT